jgi:NAD(P)-dependent dehydrogenase (short-subunit alcohol dehydrogenase family)
MIARGYGRVINVASVAAFTAPPELMDAVAYTAEGGVVSPPATSRSWARHGIP